MKGKKYIKRSQQCHCRHLDWIIHSLMELSCAHSEMFSSIFGLCPLDASDTPTSFPPQPPNPDKCLQTLSSISVLDVFPPASHCMSPFLPVPLSPPGMGLFVRMSSFIGNNKRPSERLQWVLTLIQARLPVSWIFQTLLWQASCFLIILMTSSSYRR